MDKAVPINMFIVLIKSLIKKLAIHDCVKTCSHVGCIVSSTEKRTVWIFLTLVVLAIKVSGHDDERTMQSAWTR